jgi:acetoin utilization protein AcuB
MLVKNWMSKKVITIDAKSSMQEAINRMKEHQVRMLPVLKDGVLVGVISDTDLKRASASDATTLDIHELVYLLSRLSIEKIMTKNPLTVPPDFTVEEAVEVFMKNRISGAPVVDAQGKVVGIITRHDIFKLIITLTGLSKGGINFAFQVDDRPGSIKELTDILRSYGGRLDSILTSYEDAPAGFRHVYIRVSALKREELPRLLAELQAQAKVLYWVDHRENKREIFD